MIIDSKVTRRSTVESLEEVLFEEFKVLDKGFIRVIDYMGDDNAVVQAARVSYGKGTKHSSKDQALINYLMRNNHSTPFEMCEIKLHIKLPIFVARQWIRHRTANINEYSARYSILDNEFYVPELENIAIQSFSNNQGRENEPLPFEIAKKVQNLLKTVGSNCYKDYENFLEIGLARELARINLSVNFYTQLYWKIDLHNLLHFVKLRNDSHAQYEIRRYAAQILELVKIWVPKVYTAFIEYGKDSVKISKSGIEIIKKMLQGKEVNYKDYGIGKKEWGEISNIFDLTD